MATGAMLAILSVFAATVAAAPSSSSSTATSPSPMPSSYPRLPTSWVAANANPSLLEALRGGAGPPKQSQYWWQSLFARPKQYRQALEDQISWLEQQIRQVMEEKRLLQQRNEKLFLLPGSRDVNYKSDLQALQLQVGELEEGKQVLVELLEEQTEKINHLTKLCHESQSNRMELEKSYQNQLEDMEHQLEEQTQKQLEQLDTLLNQRVEQAQERAKREIWNDYHQSNTEGKLRAKLASKYTQELELERQKTTAAIEKQRQKMRTLAKAMAIREQKLAAKQNELQQQQQHQEQEQADPAERLEAERVERERLEQEQQRRAKQEQQAEQQRLLKEKLEMERLEKQEQRRLEKEQRQLEKQRLREEKLVLRATASSKTETTTTPFAKLKVGAIKFWKGDTSSPSLSNRKKKMLATTSPKASIECWQRGTPWQPRSLPPTNVVKFTYN